MKETKKRLYVVIENIGKKSEKYMMLATEAEMKKRCKAFEEMHNKKDSIVVYWATLCSC